MPIRSVIVPGTGGSNWTSESDRTSFFTVISGLLFAALMSCIIPHKTDKLYTNARALRNIRIHGPASPVNCVAGR